MIFKRKLDREGSGHIPSTEGSTIIEALIASVILVIGLVGFLKVAISTTNLGGKNTKMATAISLVNDKYEELVLADYACMTPSPPPSCPLLSETGIDIDSGGTIVLTGPFNRTVATSALPDGTDTKVAQNVTITIAWLNHTVSQTSIFMRR